MYIYGTIMYLKCYCNGHNDRLFPFKTEYETDVGDK